MRPVCLALDPHTSFGADWKASLREVGFELLDAASIEGALQLLATCQTAVKLILISVRDESDGGALASLARLREKSRNVPVILMAARGSEKLAVTALRLRFDDYFRIPQEMEQLLQTVRALAGCPCAEHRSTHEALIGTTEVMLRTKARLERVAASDANVLITGETGTGKELAAGFIHQHSCRCGAPLVSVNCAAIPETLIESEMFGYERGAFTGASNRKIGWLEAADQGTLFLDEIGDLSSTAQAKLLRVIENKAFYRLGGHVSVSPKVRFVAATHRDLDKMSAEGQFRQDLFYRLNVARVHLPPLRERRDDIPLLLHHYIQEINNGRCKLELSDEVLETLMSHEWPGNIRELKNVLEALAVNALQNPVQTSDLPPALRDNVPPASYTAHGEREELLAALLCTKWNKTKAAERLHWSRMTLYRKLLKYHIVEPPR